MKIMNVDTLASMSREDILEMKRKEMGDKAFYKMMASVVVDRARMGQNVAKDIENYTSGMDTATYMRTVSEVGFYSPASLKNTHFYRATR